MREQVLGVTAPDELSGPVRSAPPTGPDPDDENEFGSYRTEYFPMAPTHPDVAVERQYATGATVSIVVYSDDDPFVDHLTSALDRRHVFDELLGAVGVPDLSGSQPWRAVTTAPDPGTSAAQSSAASMAASASAAAAAQQHPCAAGDLTATARRVEGGTQTYADVLTFTNRSGQACGVTGAPRVRLSAEDPLAFTYAGGQYQLMLRTLPGGPVLLQPGEAAYVYLSKPGCSRTTVAVARAATVTVEGGSVEVRLPRSGQGALALCGPDADDPGNLVRVTPFQPDGPR